MCSHEPPQTNDNSRSKESERLISSIQEDLQLLVDTLTQQMEVLTDPDCETLGVLWKARAAAERALRLSRHLPKGTPLNGPRPPEV